MGGWKPCIDPSVIAWTDGWMDVTVVAIQGCRDARMGKQMNTWMDDWVDECVDTWIGRYTIERWMNTDVE